jgi:AmmeMemoRadiSam system protein A
VAVSAPPALGELGASFVTLERGERLLGCIGTIEAVRPLYEDVMQNAYKSAFQDPRLPAVTADDYAAMSVKVSVLTPLVPMPAASRAELLGWLRPGTDGLLISSGLRRATFLPSVWPKVASPDEFVDLLLVKAGFGRGTWPGSRPGGTPPRSSPTPAPTPLPTVQGVSPRATLRPSAVGLAARCGRRGRRDDGLGTAGDVAGGPATRSSSATSASGAPARRLRPPGPTVARPADDQRAVHRGVVLEGVLDLFGEHLPPPLLIVTDRSSSSIDPSAPTRPVARHDEAPAGDGREGAGCLPRRRGSPAALALTGPAIRSRRCQLEAREVVAQHECRRTARTSPCRSRCAPLAAALDDPRMSTIVSLGTRSTCTRLSAADMGAAGEEEPQGRQVVAVAVGSHSSASGRAKAPPTISNDVTRSRPPRRARRRDRRGQPVLQHHRAAASSAPSAPVGGPVHERVAPSARSRFAATAAATISSTLSHSPPSRRRKARADTTKSACRHSVPGMPVVPPV